MKNFIRDIIILAALISFALVAFDLVSYLIYMWMAR